MRWKVLDKSELDNWEPAELHRGACWIRYIYDGCKHETVGNVSWQGKGGKAGLFFECDFGNVSEYVTHYCPIPKPEEA